MVRGVTGRLDINSTGEFEEMIKSKIDSGEKFVMLDLSQLDFITSSGLGAIMFLAKSLKEIDGKFALFSLQEQVMDIFEISGFPSIMSIFPTHVEALSFMEAN